MTDRGLEKSRRKRQKLRRHLAARGIRDDRVLDAMAAVPREEFVLPAYRRSAYADRAMCIGLGQTISQPYVVARMAEALELDPDHRVLEVGTGSGYAAAVLGRLCAAVYTVERHEPLARSAKARLRVLGCDNVQVRTGDGSRGWSEHAPYDAISVAAAGPEVPATLREQLRAGGRLVMPVGATHGAQALMWERYDAGGVVESGSLGMVRFVPLVVSGG